MDKEAKIQFILNLAKELIASGKYPVPRKELIISNISIIPRFDTKYESISERQKLFISGYRELVKSISELYDDLLE